jgi:hypothetical protein
LSTGVSQPECLHFKCPKRGQEEESPCGGGGRLKDDGEVLEEVPCGGASVTSGAACAARRHLTENGDCIGIPSSERLDNEGNEINPLGMAGVGVSPHFGGLSEVDGSTLASGSLNKASSLDWRDDRDIKCRLLSIAPHWNKDVGGSRQGAWDELRHFLLRGVAG